ncbi:MAG: putative acetyltransferase, partial [Glaciecola sp.]
MGDASLLLVTTTDGIWLGQQTALDSVTWQPLVAVPGQRHAQAAGELVWMHDDTAVRVIDPDVLPLLLGVPPLPPSIAELNLPPFDPANPIGPLPGTLATADRTVRVTPGEAVDVDLLLDVPALAPKVDLMFLVARNGSMDDELDELTDEFFFILKQLQDRKVDVNVGIGVYGSQVRYHRYRDIGPANDSFKKIVDDIHGYGGTLSAFTAIDAAMVGTIYPVSGDKFATYKGLETHWRPNSTRIVLHVADAVPFGNS